MPEDTEVDAPVEQAQEEPTGQPRDEQGRFAEVVEEPPVEPGQEEEPGPPPQTVPEEPVQYPAFTYRGDGQDFDVPGSAVGDQGVFFPNTQVQWLRSILGEGVAHRGSWRNKITDYQRQIDELTKGSQSEVVQARETLNAFKELIKRGPEAIQAWIEDYQNNYEVLEAKAQVAALESERADERKRLEQYDADKRDGELGPQKEQGLRNTILAYMNQYPGVDGMMVYRQLKQPYVFSQVFYRADRDDPDAGLKKGDTGINLEIVRAVFEQEAARANSTAQALSTVGAVQKENERATATSKAPPAVGAKGTPTPTAGKKRKFTSKEEVDAWIESGEWKKDSEEG